MPPTKATSSSTTHTLWCSRRSCEGCNQAVQRSSGRNTCNCTLLSANAARSQGSAASEPKPSTSRCTATPRPAASRSAASTAWPAASSWKM